jgi:excisionase family DNA binding protein
MARTKGAKQRSYNPASMTPKQASRFLGIDQRRLPALVAYGIIPAYKMGRGWTRYKLADLKAAKPGLRRHLRAAEKANGGK